MASRPHSVRRQPSIHNALLGGASALAMVAFATTAYAQATNGDVETVVVTGIRASLESAQAIKQNSDQVVDSISAVDIGALPDRNVADALQRVPGVTLQRTDAARDPVRYGGTGNTIFVRGLSWVQSLTNGRDTFSAVNGRTLSWADVSASLLGGVDVYKSPDAEMIEGGVGGVVNLKTRKPFDNEGLLIAGSADYTYGDLIEKGTGSYNALISDRWQTGMGEMGLLLSVDYQDQTNRTNGISTSHYDCVNATTGGVINNSSGVPLYGSPECKAAAATDGVVYIPNFVGWRTIDWEQKRFAVDGSFQWQPNEHWEFTAEVFYSKATPHDVEHTFPYPIPQDGGHLGDYTYNSKGVWTGGLLPLAQTGGIDTRIGDHENITTDGSIHGVWTPNSRWTFTADVQHIYSSATNYSLTSYSDFGNPNDGQTPGVPGEDLTLHLLGNNPRASVSDPAALNDPSSYYYAATMDHLEWNSAREWAYRVDGTYNFEDNSWLKSVDFGYRGEERASISRQTGYNWSILSHQSWGGGPPVFLDQNLGAHTTEHFKYGNFLGSSFPGGWFVAPGLLDRSTSYAYSILAATETNGWGWVPYSVSSGCAAPGEVISKDAELHCRANYTSQGQGNDTIRGVNRQHETTNAGYIQVNYARDNFLGTGMAIDGNFGVRYVRTEEEAAAGDLFLSPISVGSCDPAFCGEWNDAIQFTNGGAGGKFDLPARNQSYTDWLPSFNARLHITDQIQSRFAFSQGLVRPDFSYTVNQAQLSYSVSGTAGEVGKITARAGTAGNPELKPLRANNYDWTLEWYFAAAGSLTLDLFHKDLKDYWLTVGVPVQFTNNGITDTFRPNTYVNGDKGTVQGFELAYQQYYDFLPGPLSGLGLQANYTRIWNSGGANISQNPFDTTQGSNSHVKLPLEGMSDKSYNIALLYSKYDIDARLAYNWRSIYLLTSSAANVNQPIWSEDYGQLDGSIFYTLMEHYKVGVQVTNILAPKTYLDAGYADFHPRYDWIETDRKFSFIIRASW